MSTDTTLEILSTDSEHTERIGEAIGKQLRGGEIIELISDVGGGKTTLMRGLAHGAGSRDAVASPTFTISKLYNCPNFAIHHLDLYRLGDEPGIIRLELGETIGRGNDVVAIEWASSLTDVLPEARLKVHIQLTTQDQRHITLSLPKTLDYLIRGIKT